MNSNCLVTASPTQRLQGKVALITGGASGIGEATARLFVEHGAKVIIADIQDDLGHSLCQELNSQGEIIITYLHCDVTSDSDVEAAVNLAVSKYGKLDIMFNNAGIVHKDASKVCGRIVDTDNQDFKGVFDVNVFGAFLGAKYAAKVMIPAKKGCILFTSSTSSILAEHNISHAYVASKHAVVGLTKSLCVELGQYGIRVNCISPFGVATPMARNFTGMTEKEVQEMVSEAANLKGVVLKAEDIAEAALYLASDESKYVSGINLVVDGGYTVTNPSFALAAKTRFS